MVPVTLAVAGAGLRGLSYARHARAAQGTRVVAVAEPDPERRRRFAAEFGLADDRVFDDWRALADAGRLADAAVVATMDRCHSDPAVRLADLGYHVLLEKPMATTEADAARVAEAARRNGTIMAVCHVLRYTPYTRMVKRLLDEGALGRLTGIEHLEPVGWWHQAHSFVRGNWRRSDTSAAMLLTKACHDVDWLLHLFGSAPQRVSSFGGLLHFRPENRPAQAGERCLECRLEPQCPYSAPRLYLGCLGDADLEFWPLSAVTPGRTGAEVIEALRTGPYGRCVYSCDNDVVDQQVVLMEFAGGATCSFTMSAFTPMGQRRTRLFGTHGFADGDGRSLRVTDFRDGSERVLRAGPADGGQTAEGHADGDRALTEAFLAAVAAGDPALLESDPEQSLASHRVVWAAERARTTGTVIELPAGQPAQPGIDRRLP
jgi:predicted dehydrogenase